MEIKAYIDEKVGGELRKQAFKRFGYFKGSLSKSIEEAVIQWLKNTEKLEERLNTLIEKADNDKNVVAVILFGSFAEGKTDYRDIDLAFLLANPKNSLSTLSAYEDFKEDLKFDISCLNSLAVNVRKEVLNSGKVLLCKNKPKFYEFMIDTLREYEDFKHVYELMLYGRNR